MHAVLNISEKTLTYKEENINIHSHHSEIISIKVVVYSFVVYFLFCFVLWFVFFLFLFF